MGSYSKIASIELTNFMSFKKAKLTFDESGILNIKGYNDSGKSSILRGIVVCLMDMFKRSQLKFIRHGEEYFRVVVTFDDGVSILRDKYINGQNLYEMYKDGDLLFTTKQGNKLSRVEGVPKVIEDYLGLCVTDSVYLNYQSCIDRLPVVDTKGSENYQMLHEVLRMEEIFIANNMINIDKNDLALDISTMQYNLQREEILLERCGDVSDEFISEIEKLHNEALVTNKKQDDVRNIASIVGEYSKIKSIPNIDKVCVDRYSKAQDIKWVLTKLDSIENIPRIDLLDCTQLAKVENIEKIIKELDKVNETPRIDKISVERLQSLNSIKGVIGNLSKYRDIPSISKVDVNLLSRNRSLVEFYSVLNELDNKINVCTDIDMQLNDVESRLDTLVKEAKEKGVSFVKCNNCGSYTDIGGGDMGE